MNGPVRPDADPPRPLSTLSIVLPCHNEAPNVEAAVAEADAAARRVARAYEVIVVDDGSTDETRALAARLCAARPHVRLVAHDHNRGYGAAVRSGIDASRGEWVLLTDGDRQFDLAELELLVGHTADSELVAGFRVGRADPAARRAAAFAWNRLVRWSFGIGVRDVDCAFKLARGPALRALELDSDGAMVSTELVARAQRAGWRIAEVGVHHRPRTAGEPSGGDLRVIARAFREHRRLHQRLREQQRARGQHRGRTATA